MKQYTMKQKYLLARAFLRSRQGAQPHEERKGDSREGLHSKTSCVYYTANKRYCPHLLETKLHAVALYRQSKDLSFVCRRYHVSKASLMRWNKAYDETKESLMSKSHRPHSPHPNAHTEQEIKWIKDYRRRNPNISICELYGKLRYERAYSRHPGSLYRVFVRLGFRQKPESTKEKSNQKHRDLETRHA